MHADIKDLKKVSSKEIYYILLMKTSPHLLGSQNISLHDIHYPFKTFRGMLT